jgi:hypothetical protein
MTMSLQSIGLKSCRGVYGLRDSFCPPGAVSSLGYVLVGARCDLGSVLGSGSGSVLGSGSGSVLG